MAACEFPPTWTSRCPSFVVLPNGSNLLFVIGRIAGSSEQLSPAASRREELTTLIRISALPLMRPVRKTALEWWRL